MFMTQVPIADAVFALQNLASIDKLKLQKGSKVQVNDKNALNAKNTQRKGGSSIKFGDKVSKSDKQAILNKTKQDNRDKIAKLKAKGGKETTKERTALGRGIKNTNTDLKRLDKIILLI